MIRQHWTIKGMVGDRANISKRRLVKAIGATVGLTALATAAWAGFDQGATAYKRGDYGTALREWRPLADRGDASAQYTLAFLYAKGLGVAQDDAVAARWLRKAADQGHSTAQYFLGLTYVTGRGVPRDKVQAFMWLDLAALHSLPGRNRGRAVAVRDMIAKEATPAQIAEARRLTRDWLKKRGQEI